ncbi:hypothetical protein [Kitasatospora purpeofusca]|uniref:hypothetical protein n=1 Tax=Kitasatospora purpeofusca TaxID=67352 RepID=UPI003868B069
MSYRRTALAAVAAATGSSAAQPSAARPSVGAPIGACPDRNPGAGVCSSGPNYGIALNGAGRINEIRELYAS